MYINRSKKIVIKIGSSILIDSNGKLKKKMAERICKRYKISEKEKKRKL